MRQSDKDYLNMLSAIADYVRGNPQDYYNTQKIAGYIRSVIGEEKLPKGRSGRIFSNLYEKKIFIRNTDLASGKMKRYFVYVDLRNIERTLASEGSPVEEAKKAVRSEIRVSYTLGGEPVSDEFYKKFSSRFTETEKGASYTFRGSSVPEGLNALIESVLADG
jgi:hypothetical protein